MIYIHSQHDMLVELGSPFVTPHLKPHLPSHVPVSQFYFWQVVGDIHWREKYSKNTSPVSTLSCPPPCPATSCHRPHSPSLHLVSSTLCSLDHLDIGMSSWKKMPQCQQHYTILCAGPRYLYQTLLRWNEIGGTDFFPLVFERECGSCATWDKPGHVYE